MANRVKSIMIHADNFKAYNKLSDTDKLALIDALMSDISGDESPELSPRADVVKDYIDEQNARFRSRKSNADNDANEHNAVNADNDVNALTRGRAVSVSVSVPVSVPVPKAKAETKEETSGGGLTRTGAREGDEHADEAARICAHYADTIGSLVPPMVHAGILGFLDVMEPAVIVDAIDIAAAENKRNWSYINAILTRRKASGVVNMADVAREQEEHRQRKARASPDKDTTNPFLRIARELEQEGFHDTG